jgi:hypothetical protein
MNDEILKPARQRYGPNNWDRAQREGAALTVNEAIELVLAQTQLAPDAPRPPIDGSSGSRSN